MKLVVAALLSLAPALAAQTEPPHGPPPPTGADSISIAAGVRYKAGGLHRWFFGDTYRDLWKTPTRVQVLNLRTFAGGLRPVKTGGGNQTRSLRLVNPDGVEYVFRLVDKDKVQTPPVFKGTIVDKVFRDQVSTSHPGAALAAAPMLDAAGVLHATPVLAVMPDDSLLGEFRPAFAGTLGLIEEYPGKPKHGVGFAGAKKIIDSEDLLRLLYSDPRQQVDTRAFLAARLMDMLLNDWDRHPGQWKWARMESGPTNPWQPIPRDRDKVFVASDGLVATIARFVNGNLIPFDDAYPSVRSLTWNSLEFDRRMLDGLEKPVWDSVAAALVHRVTDSVIDAALKALPPEYQPSVPHLASSLKGRRTNLPEMANHFYRTLARVADVHGTDAADRATITGVDGRFVEVRIESGGGSPYFLRRFDAQETHEIRVYLHGGDDTAFVTGRQDIKVRVIGGNGVNQLTDSSGAGSRVQLLDAGTVQDVAYGPDTAFNRIPWVREYGHLKPPSRDHGDSVVPAPGLSSNRDLGILPRLSVSKYEYGFRDRPYASVTGIHAEYSTGVNAFRIALTTDQRRQSSAMHFIAVARMSELELIRYHGLGNATTDTGPTFYDVRQRQWLLQPAVAWSLGTKSELAVGPAIQYTTTDSLPGSFIAADHPYGFAKFGEAGLRVLLHYDGRDNGSDPHRGFLVDASSSFYPAVWDVTSAFGSVAAAVATYVTIPVPLHPIVVLRGGAKQVFGNYPFHEAAFIGGRTTLRSLDAQRYAGDAAVYGTIELRVTVVEFPFILPLNVGLFATQDVGRVFVDGESPGGWHSATGVGFWIGVMNPANSIRVCRRPSGSGPC